MCGAWLSIELHKDNVGMRRRDVFNDVFNDVIYELDLHRNVLDFKQSIRSGNCQNRVKDSNHTKITTHIIIEDTLARCGFL